MGKAVLKTICAFANGEEGKTHILLLGVQRRRENDPASYEVVGVDAPDKLTAELVTDCKRKLSFDVPLEIYPEKHHGKIHLVIKVKGVPKGEKPVSIISGKGEGTYSRIGASTQKCSSDDYKRMVQDSSAENYDLTLLPYSDMEDISDKAIAEYRKARKEMRPSAPELAWEDEELLKALNAIRK